jgi:hypothetical protein
VRGAEVVGVEEAAVPFREHESILAEHVRAERLQGAASRDEVSTARSRPVFVAERCSPPENERRTRATRPVRSTSIQRNVCTGHGISRLVP